MAVCVTIMLPAEGVFREMVVGFHRVAVARGWVLVKTGRLFNVNPIEPDVIVCNHLTYHDADPAVRAKCVVVAIGGDLTAAGVPSVVVDETPIGLAAARHLLDKGLRSFAVYGLDCAESVNPFAAARAGPFRAAVEATGASFTGWGRGRRATLATSTVEWTHDVPAWLAAMPKPVGIFGCCDAWSERLVAECRVLGLRIPEDVAVVSADNTDFVCEMTTPPLSSVIIPWERMGHEAARLVEARLDGRACPAGPVRVPPGDVVVRRSSDFWAVDDPEVMAALSYIRAHAGQVIGVPDVVRQTTTYRRELERRFKATIGLTIMDEVRRVHLDQAKRLLSLTDLSIADVADRSGFPSAKKLSETFRRELSVTPRDYRRQFRLKA